MWILFLYTQSRSWYHVVDVRYAVFLGQALGLTAVLPFGGFFANLLAQISMLTSHYCGLRLPLFVMVEGHNTWEITETLFAASGRHSSLWPKVTTIERSQIVALDWQHDPQGTQQQAFARSSVTLTLIQPFHMDHHLILDILRIHSMNIE